MKVQAKFNAFLAPPATGPEALRHGWVLLALLGGALAFVGALAVGAAFITTLTTVIVFGVLLLVAGVVEVVNSFWARAWRGFLAHLLAGVVYVIVGLLMIEHPAGTAAGVTLMVAASLLVGGLARIFMAVLERFEGWGWTVCSGVVAVLLGALISRQWPASGLWVIGLFVGIELMVNGWTWLMLAFALKRLAAPEAPVAAVRPEADEAVRERVGQM